jgi:hypothetical protein
MLFAGIVDGVAAIEGIEDSEGIDDSDCVKRVSSPVPDEVPIGWCAVDDAVLTVTHRGTLIRRDRDGWRTVGPVPTPGNVRGRYIPLE